MEVWKYGSMEASRLPHFHTPTHAIMSTFINGIIAATLTPYRRDGSPDLEMVGRHVEYLLAGGIPAVAPAGTTGEFLYLSEAERAAVARAAVEAAAGRLKVIAGIWAADVEG